MKWPSAEMIAACAALVGSAVAIFVAFDQSNVSRKQMRDSARPILQVDMIMIVDDSNHKASIRAKNVGVGPADVKFEGYSLSGQLHDRIDSELLSIAARTKNLTVTSSNLRGRVVGIGEPVLPIQIINSFDENSNVSITGFHDLGFHVCYCSIHNECWHSTNLGMNSTIDSASRCTEAAKEIASKWQLQTGISEN